MNPCIVSFFMDNIDRKTVLAQRAVVDKFNKSNVPHYQIKVDVRHGAAIDYFWAMNGVKTHTMDKYDIEQKLNHDVILILDLDCVPLSPDAIDTYLDYASNTGMIGNAQRSNHIENNQHVFAAPSATAISRDNFIKIRSPSALETKRSDVLEEYSWEAKKYGVDINLVMPLRFDSPPKRFEWEKDQPEYWALADGMPVYGMGTTYGIDGQDLFYHNFQIFHPGQQEKFWAKCESLL